MAGLLLQALDPTAGVLDIGILSVLLFAVLAALLAIYCCYWLQELLWQPFKIFRQNLFYHFNQLTSWQQCIIYFSVFFLSLFSFWRYWQSCCRATIRRRSAPVYSFGCQS
ncbi:hypothetical protein KUH03_31010 [Sphingobacterium sp. E70]|uniref:hypothetical protein n=1 Tax=Sphingobacterium sp. E70 TaxID=2853439 RepID=UPI00211C51B0|nr:hypothetical protein [Sphingobacterium sp. E70]ULT23566.1 hypothetical protein KUH03_31010 [Sphingobacterium sp. E70]